ncbi:MAG TPA: translation elongation factor 4 [Thermoguttaceae bacterium]|nr:translation elongation factor 4 [Thermoguttaceae bacterium]
MKHIRNFCIIAHIDHGKSTLADRLIQACGGVSEREFRNQLLDSMDIERERGITIKSNSITLSYHAADGQEYLFNLIDTPGHVDFSHEVRRSLMACEGALLVVDASQGVEAQTVANLYQAIDHNLTILPVINKIDLPAADIDRAREEIDADLGLDPFEAIPVSAKTGQGIDAVLAGIAEKLPGPKGDPDAPLKILVFDAQFDRYRGVILQCRVMDGTVKPDDVVHFMHSGWDYTVEEVGINRLKSYPQPQLSAGEVGYVIAGIKSVRDIEIGDTVTHRDRPAAEPIPGYKKAKQVVFSSIYPINADEYRELAQAMDKLAINDASLTYEKDSSAALGFGFRCGFLGLLHLDVIQERLQREFDIGLVVSAPSVKYNVSLKDGRVIEVDNPGNWPDPMKIAGVTEPYIKASILTPEEYVGAVMDLCRDYRSAGQQMSYLAVGRVEVTSEMPLGEVLFDFYGKLKTVTRGYGSFDYVTIDYRETDVVKVEILINGEPVDALAYLVHRDKARARAMHYCEQLAEAIPRHQFKIPIQGTIGGKIIARTTINAYRKDVTAKCYGGDVTRKKKLLEKQKKGKARMKQVGQVQIPQKAFISVLAADRK